VSRNGGYRAVVVAPTKELAQQFLAVCSGLCEGTGLRCHSLGKVRGSLTVRTALYCTALHCTALHCTALHCTALHR
jgi:superfamily II DNA/RNA helicase